MGSETFTPDAGGETFTVVGLGELIWDMLPAGRRLGGAPTNFAYVSRLLGGGADTVAVASRVGRDALGREALERLTRAGVSTEHVQIDATHPTGTVGVTLDAHGEANFNVNQNSAWDYLEWSAGWEELAARADAVCFGTLGQRAAQSRAVIARFLHRTRPGALRVFDVNLRHAFFDAAMLAASLRLASVVKLGREELPLVAEMTGVGAGDDGDERATAERLARAFDLRLVAVTRGARGSLLVTPTEAFEHTGFRVRVADTIGAGDAFAAALVNRLLRHATLAEAGDAANRAGAWVTTQSGATPDVDPADVPRILESVGPARPIDDEPR
ncbi:MAG TPA: carbohydrate kinase [Pyrinomonadaceae bacterium]